MEIPTMEKVVESAKQQGIKIARQDFVCQARNLKAHGFTKEEIRALFLEAVNEEFSE